MNRKGWALRCLGPVCWLVAGWDARARADDASLPPTEEIGKGAMFPEAREHYDRGSMNYNLGEYGQAIVEFKAAYRAEPRIQFLWALAQAERLKGDCRSAIRSYESFLRSGPTQTGAGLAWAEIAACEARLLVGQSTGTVAASEPARAAPSAPTSRYPRTAARPVRTTAGAGTRDLGLARGFAAEPAWPREGFWHDRAGHALLWPGAAALGVGVVLLAIGNDHITDAANRDDYAAYLAARDRAGTLQRTGAGFLVAGGALVSAGIVRFAWVSHHAAPVAPAETSTRVTAALLSGGGALSVAGVF